MLHLRELPRAHRARADVAHLARLDQVVQRLHDLLGRDGRVEAVDLQEVDVRRVQALQRLLDVVEDRGAREAGLVDVLLALVHGGEQRGREDVVVGTLADEAVALGRDDDLLAGDLVLNICKRLSFFQPKSSSLPSR